MKIGIDFGGHTIVAALIASNDGEPPKIVRHVSERTPRGRGAADVFDLMAEIIRELAQEGPVESAGIAIPAMVDADRRHARKMPNFPPEWDDLDIVAALTGASTARGLDIPVKIENDANCYALGEGSAGVARGVRDFVVLTMGTGIGCGIVIGGSLLTGAHGMAGETGHAVVFGSAPCGCGGMGHAETLAAADGTAARARAAGMPEDFRTLWEMRGDARADAVIETTLDAMARTVATTCHVLDPEMIVIGGGMSRAHLIGEAIAARAVPYLSRPFKQTLRVEISALGNDAALFGAASL